MTRSRGQSLRGNVLSVCGIPPVSQRSGGFLGCQQANPGVRSHPLAASGYNPLVAVESSGKEGGPSEATSSTTMASDDCSKYSLEENRTDSGIDSIRSILKSEPREPSSDFSLPREKFSVVEERLDSAYDSSSITGESLSELVGGCRLSSAQKEQTSSSELSEQEENLLTSITEDGDT